MMDDSSVSGKESKTNLHGNISNPSSSVNYQQQGKPQGQSTGFSLVAQLATRLLGFHCGLPCCVGCVAALVFTRTSGHAHYLVSILTLKRF